MKRAAIYVMLLGLIAFVIGCGPSDPMNENVKPPKRPPPPGAGAGQ